MKVSLIVLVLITLLATGQTAGAQCTQNGKETISSLVLSAVQDTVKTGSPVMVTVVMINKSNHDVSVWIENGEGEDQYLVDVRDDQGNLPSDTEHGRRRNGHVDPAQLKPQELKGSGGCITLR